MSIELEPQPKQLEFLDALQSVVFYGGGAGAGKTWSILAHNLTGVHDPDYFSVFVRKTTNELETNLWPEALKMYEKFLKDENGNFIGKAHINEQKKVITFPSGARSKFTYMMYDKDADSWYGAEVTRWYIDEAQQHTDHQFQIMRSRNRSRANVSKGIYCTLNPSCESFIYEWVKPFIDEEGFPIQEFSGRTRYFVIIGGILHTSWDKLELSCESGKNPQTYTYIPSTLDDNQILEEQDPEYRDILDSMPEKKRRQLLEGCWLPDEESGRHFNVEWLRRAEAVPEGCTTCRGWDLAAGEDNPEENIFPDFTAGVRMSKSKDGRFFIHGATQFKKRSGARDNKIIEIAFEDSKDCYLVVPQDPAAAGKQVFEDFAKRCSENGLKCKKDPFPNNRGKLVRFEPFSIAAENGLVYIVESDFTESELKALLYSLTSFTGERSTRTYKDDYPDAAATAFNFLNSQRTVSIVSRNQGSADSLSKDFLSKNKG